MLKCDCALIVTLSSLTLTATRGAHMCVYMLYIYGNMGGTRQHVPDQEKRSWPGQKNLSEFIQFGLSLAELVVPRT